jgi:predicted RNA-binding protein associated with RNAse of E/G family
MTGSAPIASREWQNVPQMTDYRSEWLSDVLVERATWKVDAPARTLSELSAIVTIAAPGYVWLRFWFKTENHLVEKYLNPTGETVGYYAPICMPLEQAAGRLIAKYLLLALWIDRAGRIIVLGEEDFEYAVSTGTLAPVEIEQAEYRVRELTRAVGQRRFPPALARNFTLHG